MLPTSATKLSISIRAAVESDLPAIVDIYNAAIPGRTATADLEPISVASRQKWFHDRDHHKYPIWVAEVGAQNADHITQSQPNLAIEPMFAPDSSTAAQNHQTSSKVVGWLSVQRFYGRCAYAGTVEVSIYVAENQQGQGIGQELLRYAIATCPQIGITCLMGLIFAHNQPSLRLFQKFGFAKWGHLPQIAQLDGVKRDLVILGLHLSNPQSV
jgi:L-amino acid N-acyltransferase YncA